MQPFLTEACRWSISFQHWRTLSPCRQGDKVHVNIDVILTYSVPMLTRGTEMKLSPNQLQFCITVLSQPPKFFFQYVNPYLMSSMDDSRVGKHARMYMSSYILLPRLFILGRTPHSQGKFRPRFNMKTEEDSSAHVPKVEELALTFITPSFRILWCPDGMSFHLINETVCCQVD